MHFVQNLYLWAYQNFQNKNNNFDNVIKVISEYICIGLQWMDFIY